MAYDDFEDDAALDELEARLKSMPPSPKDPPALTHPLATRRMVWRMARIKRQAIKRGAIPQMSADVAFHQSMHSIGHNDWYTFTSEISQETIERVQTILDRYFGKKNLEVKKLEVIMHGFHSGASGTYTMLIARFTVV